MGPAYKPPTTAVQRSIFIPEDDMQEILSKAQELRVSEGVRDPRKLGSSSEEKDRYCMVNTTVHDRFPDLTLCCIENRKESSFSTFMTLSHYESQLILNYLTTCLYYSIKRFWSVNSTFIRWFYSFLKLWVYVVIFSQCFNMKQIKFFVFEVAEIVLGVKDYTQV